MDNNIRTQLRTLELQNEAKAQYIANAHQTISELEQKVSDLTDAATNPSVVDEAPIVSDAQIEFIRKVADSRVKFAKEAQDIVDAHDIANPPMDGENG